MRHASSVNLLPSRPGYMVPVALPLLPLATDFSGLDTLPAGRPALRRPDQPDAALVIARHHRCYGMAETVAVARLDQRQLRLHRIKEDRA